MPVLKGGWPVYGIPIGIIMLDCKFPRPVGDVGNAGTFPFPVAYEVLREIIPAELIGGRKPEEVERLLCAARNLERLGVGGILTSCGLLIQYQKELTRAVNIPVASSSLLLLPLIGAMIPAEKKVAVLSSKSLGSPADIAESSGWKEPGRIVVAGLEGCEVFNRSINRQMPPYEMDTEVIYSEVLRVCKHLFAAEQDIAALLLECTNLGPYSGRLRGDLGVPVFDFNQLVQLLQSAVAGCGRTGGCSCRPDGSSLQG